VNESLVVAESFEDIYNRLLLPINTDIMVSSREVGETDMSDSVRKRKGSATSEHVKTRSYV
jgi:hypothetical protein